MLSGPIAGVFVVAATAVASANALVLSASQRYLSDEPTSLPDAALGLVLGCAPLSRSGGPNRYFVLRMDAVAELYHRGKLERVVVSGGPVRRRPDRSTNAGGMCPEPATESEWMRRALVQRGVPSDVIVQDDGGFRTWESVRRARVYQGRTIIIVSQAFHTPRAVFLARWVGLQALGFNAASPSRSCAPQARLQLREMLSRCRALADVLASRVA